MEDEFDILRINGRREMVEERFRTLPTAAVEHLKYECLNVGQVVRVALELGEKVSDVVVTRCDLLLKQVRLVEKEDNGNIGETLVVHYRLKDHTRLDQTVCASVFHDHLVVRRRRHHE